MNRRGFLALSGLTVAAAGADDVARLLAQARTAATGAWSRRLREHPRFDRPGSPHLQGRRVRRLDRGRKPVSAGRKPEPWSGVRSAAEYSPRAYQPFRPMIPEIGNALTGSGAMTEDCLRLNVWTPATGTLRRPVMVWFHGGGHRRTVPLSDEPVFMLSIGSSS